MWSRHFWPPSLLGIVVIVLVASVFIGFCGGFVYTQTGAGKVELQDPAGPERSESSTPVATQKPAAPTTTKVEVLSVEALGRKVAPSVWHVSTLDEAGRPVEASALVAGSFGGQSFLLTSFAVVRAATRSPGPEIVVSNGGGSAPATLWTWEEDRDLALLVVARPAPPLSRPTEGPAAKAGDRVFVAADGTGLAPGKITSISPTGIEHDIVIDGLHQGGALVNERGEVLGMASLDYNPGGVATDRIYVAVPIALACEQVLACSSGAGSGAPPTTEPP